MHNYLAKCPGCGYEETMLSHSFVALGSPVGQGCPCCFSPMIRRASFCWKPSMMEHYNVTLGRPVSTKRDFNDGLKRASDEQSERTGMDHHYIEVDMGDPKSLGVTSEGLDETFKKRYDAGQPINKNQMFKET